MKNLIIIISLGILLHIYSCKSTNNIDKCTNLENPFIHYYSMYQEDTTYTYYDFIPISTHNMKFHDLSLNQNLGKEGSKGLVELYAIIDSSTQEIKDIDITFVSIERKGEIYFLFCDKTIVYRYKENFWKDFKQLVLERMRQIAVVKKRQPTKKEHRAFCVLEIK